MLGLVSLQANASLETWGQNLDLTIPSLEMQSTWELDSKVKQEIMMGLTCCYRKELINYVQTEHSQKLTESMLKGNQRRLQFTLHEPITDWQWTAFVTLQFLDIYTTYKGLQYNCVIELNPILGEQPSVMKMGVTKFVILYPAMMAEKQNQTLTRDDMRTINYAMTLVIANNNAVGNRAKRNCYKR